MEKEIKHMRQKHIGGQAREEDRDEMQGGFRVVYAD